MRGHERRRQHQQQQEGMRELQMEQERRRQELLQLEPSAVEPRHPVYAAIGPAQPQPQLQPPLLGATWPSTTLEDEAERWLMQAEQDATAYAARGPPLPIHHQQQQPQIHVQQQLRPSMIAAADPVMGLSMPLDIGADGRTQQPPQMAPVKPNSFMSTSPAAAVSYSIRRPPHPPHPPPPSGPTHNTTSSRDNQ